MSDRGPGALDDLAEAVEALSEGIAVFDAEGGLVLCNEALRQLNPSVTSMLSLGARWETLLRCAVQSGVMDEASSRRMLMLEARLAPGSSPETLEIEAANGRIGAFTLSATRSGGLVLSHRDVTARRRLETDAREADAILREVLEACPAHVVMSRLGDGQVLYRSPAATELLGATRNLFDQFESRDERADFVTALLPNGRVDAMSVTCRGVGGRSFPAAISARLIDYRGEEVVVSSIVDLTGEMAMRAELAAQRETIYQAEKASALGELLAGVAHELNNPLSVVVGHALMLREDTEDPELLRRIDKIGAAAERCARIVKSFLAMARQEPATLAPVDFDALVVTAVEAVRGGPAGLGAALELALAGDLPRIDADADQIAQMVVNLVLNADQAIAKSGRGGRIMVSTARDRAAGMVELRVEDDGPGIPAAHRTRIFDPFFTTKAVGEGTGIGLALCHRIATSHGGAIRAEAARGGGAVFVVRLPATASARVDASADQPAGAAGGRARILVVDDEPEVAGLIREILERDGFEVHHAETGEAALDRLAGSSAYALILSDLAMPGIGGRGLWQAIARDNPGLARRLAFVTGDTMGPSARTFLAESGRPRLEKPIAPAELRGLVRRMLAEVGP